METIITGGLGYVARRLTPMLQNPTILDCRDEPIDFPYNYIQHDITKPLQKLKLIDAVIHLAAITGNEDCSKNPVKARKVNVEGTRNMLEFCRKNDVEQFVFASTCGIYRSKNPIYMNTKYQGEQLCKEYTENYGLKTSILRFANIYGPGFLYKKKLTVIHKFVLQALLDYPLTVVGNGLQLRDFVYVDDVCQAILYALEHKTSGIRYVGWNDNISIGDLADFISTVMDIFFDKKIVITHTYVEHEEEPQKIYIPKQHLNWKWRPNVDLNEGIENILVGLI